MNIRKSIITVAILLVSLFSFAQPQNTQDRPGPITRPMIVEIAKNTYFINEFGMNAMYVLVGDKSALVIDTGTGFCNFKGIIEKLTDLPYKVVLTHGHPDHAGGINQFETVYMNLADTAMATHIPYEQKAEYGDIMRRMSIGYKDVWGYIKEDVITSTELPEIKPIQDEQVFDLGNRKVTAYYAPGHSPGCTAFLDPTTKILFSGDAANGNVGTRLPVSQTLRYLVRLKELQPQYDRMFTGHISYAGTIDVYSQKLDVLNDIIEAFRSILRGDAEVKEVQNHLFPEMKNTVAVYGQASVGFDPKNLWEEGKEHKIY
ncbi:MBL fold metallo-hydrolase [uncultured Draconibacterium sp.]|uniref:MBL fold metallo-hydrolase n=1 Tax=uncultured Draconibacterium sp. TaxID=1573823 RepID=UPI002AA8BFD5|nr:MBL fold metallo-hydrolase [uncultured Draconibacterium sp.]